MQKCVLCEKKPNQHSKILEFSPFKLTACLNCVASSTGFTIAAPSERRFESHCAKYHVVLPNIDSSMLYNLGTPDSSCFK